MEEIENAFKLDEKTFKEKYHFDKPTKKETLIFTCRSGKRSDTASQILFKNGYTVINYLGGANEWFS